MRVDRNDLLNAIIDDGIHEIRTTYLKPEQHQKREGGIAGFEAYRGKCDEDIMEELWAAKTLTNNARHCSDPRYWYLAMYQYQVEWVVNVLSAVAFAHKREPISTPTARGMLKAADILGISV